MSKLWIVHREARLSTSLARLAGLASDDLVAGPPSHPAFAGAAPPAALLIGFTDDFELELEFLHRHREALTLARKTFLVAPEDAAEVKRLVGASDEEILDALPDARGLRQLWLGAVAHRNAEPLALRRDRERIAHRFASWFGELEIPNLLRALDPALESFPLLVRGVPGSGRALLARYVELFRVHGVPGTTIRLAASELSHIDDLADRIRAQATRVGTPARTVWIDEADALAPSAQRALAEWIRLDAAPSLSAGGSLRWIATAGPSGLRDRLDPALAGAFAPLRIEVPSLVDVPEALSAFVSQVVADWRARTGGRPRRLTQAALEALETEALVGDRAAVETLVRGALAGTAAESIQVEDLAAVAGWSTDVSESAQIFATDTETVPTPEDFQNAPVLPPASFDAEAPAFEAPSDSPDLPSAPDLHDIPDVPGPAAPPLATSDDVADFERSFEEGLGEGGDGEGELGLSDLPMAEFVQNDAPGDVSTEMAAESFALAEGRAATSDSDAHLDWRRLARSLSHEIRNPLVSIKTFTELLPENWDDEQFRTRFTELVGNDVAQIDEVIGRLSDAAAHERREDAAVDVSSMIERLLDDRREDIAARRLLVLRELERDAPIAWADAASLELALSGLLDRALAALPERGDLFVATRRIDPQPTDPQLHPADHHPGGPGEDGEPRLRVLLRHHNPEQGAGDTTGLADVGAAANVIEYVLAETIVGANGGALTIESTAEQETLIRVDLRTRA